MTDKPLLPRSNASQARQNESDTKALAAVDRGDVHILYTTGGRRSRPAWRKPRGVTSEALSRIFAGGLIWPVQHLGDEAQMTLTRTGRAVLRRSSFKQQSFLESA